MLKIFSEDEESRRDHLSAAFECTRDVLWAIAVFKCVRVVVNWVASQAVTIQVIVT